jgi:hypothetical protein
MCNDAYRYKGVMVDGSISHQKWSRLESRPLYYFEQLSNMVVGIGDLNLGFPVQEISGSLPLPDRK